MSYKIFVVILMAIPSALSFPLVADRFKMSVVYQNKYWLFFFFMHMDSTWASKSPVPCPLHFRIRAQRIMSVLNTLSLWHETWQKKHLGKEAGGAFWLSKPRRLIGTQIFNSHIQNKGHITKPDADDVGRIIAPKGGTNTRIILKTTPSFKILHG